MKWMSRIFAVLLCIAVGLCLYWALNTNGRFRKQYAPAPLTVVLDWNISRPLTLRVYYLAAKNGRFNQEHSVVRDVQPSDTHVEIELPVERIYNFRLEFGNQPENMLIKNIEIIGDMYLNFNKWNEYYYENIDKHKIRKDDGALYIFSRQNGPAMTFQFPFVLDRQK